MQGKIITISRQCGSGGHSIGSELAKRLDVPFYDREIIEMAAKESGFHQGFVEEKEEHMNSSLLFLTSPVMHPMGEGGVMRTTSRCRTSSISRR